MKFLIPPSEGKSTNNLTNIPFKETDFKFKKQVNEIIKKLKNMKSDEIKNIYGLKVEKAQLIHKINLNIKNELCSPAINRYSGVVFTNIQFDTFNQNEKDFFYKNFVIFSGLFGMISPNTLIPNYKLKMNTFQLYNLWKPILSNELIKENSIIDLLPQIHKKAYLQNENCINIDFAIFKNGKKIPAGHFGKAIKGKFIRFICKNQLTKFEDLIQFNDDNFKWDGKVFFKSF